MQLSMNPGDWSSTNFFQAHILKEGGQMIGQVAGGNYNYGEAATQVGTLIWHNTVSVVNARLSFEMRSVMPNSWGNNYVGVAFRIQNTKEYELVYFRISFSGLDNALKYIDVIDGVDRWWEKEQRPYIGYCEYPQRDWFSVEMEFRDQHLKVTVAGNPEHSLDIKAVARPVATGGIGFWAWPGSGVAHFRNVVLEER